MLKYIKNNKRKFIGIYVYVPMVMTGECILSDKLYGAIYLCDYEIIDSTELRKYIAYFNHMPDHNYSMTLSSYKHLPIKPEDKDA